MQLCSGPQTFFGFPSCSLRFVKEKVLEDDKPQAALEEAAMETATCAALATTSAFVGVRAIQVRGANLASHREGEKTSGRERPGENMEGIAIDCI